MHPSPISTTSGFPFAVPADGAAPQSQSMPATQTYHALPVGPSSAPVALSSSHKLHYSKPGRLDDFNIREFLKPLGATHGEHTEPIRPDNPRYYLRPVQRNKKIKDALVQLESHTDAIEALCQDIDRGNWEKVSHHFMQDRYPQRDWTGIRAKDLLFYAFAAGRISRAEFYTAITALNIKEQFAQEVRPQYRYKDKATGIVQSRELPSRQEAIEFFRLFNEYGTLTDKGKKYIDQITANLEKLHQDYDILGRFNRQQWGARLEAAFRTLPENLQCAFHVSNTLEASHYEEPGNPDVFWQFQLLTLMPLVAEPGVDETTGRRKNLGMYSPSNGILQAFLEQVRPGNVVAPVLCLGTVGERELASLHLQGFHPGTVRDDRVDSNYLDPHDHDAGVEYGTMHDLHFHCFCATNYSPAQRKLYCETLVRAVDRAVDPADDFEKKLGSELIALLADLAILSCDKIHLDGFLHDVFFELSPLRHGQWKGSADAYIRFFQKCLASIKGWRTGALPGQTLGHGKIGDLSPVFIEYLNKAGAVAQQAGHGGDAGNAKPALVQSNLDNCAHAYLVRLDESSLPDAAKLAILQQTDALGNSELHVAATKDDRIVLVRMLEMIGKLAVSDSDKLTAIMKKNQTDATVLDWTSDAGIIEDILAAISALNVPDNEKFHAVAAYDTEESSLFHRCIQTGNTDLASRLAEFMLGLHGIPVEAKAALVEEYDTDDNATLPPMESTEMQAIVSSYLSRLDIAGAIATMHIAPDVDEDMPASAEGTQHKRAHSDDEQGDAERGLSKRQRGNVSGTADSP